MWLLSWYKGKPSNWVNCILGFDFFIFFFISIDWSVF